MLEVDESRLDLKSGGVTGTLYRPRVERPVPAVLTIGGSDGMEPRFTAAGLARLGFTALAVSYFKGDGLPSTLREIPLEYFRQALLALRTSLASSDGPLVVYGVSRGSEAALLTAAYFPEFVGAAVAVVPGNVVLCSWPPGSPAWLLNGKPLPYVSRFGPSAEDPEALIPVERIKGPILLISAGADRVWPSTLMAKAMMSRLKERGHPYPDDHLDFPLAGHLLERAATPSASGGGNPSPSGSDGSHGDRAAAFAKIGEFLRRLT